MTITVTYTLQNTNSEYEVVGLGFLDPLTTLEGIYGNRNWSFDLVFSVFDSGAGISRSIISIVTTKPSYVLDSNTANTVTLSKNPGSVVFPGEQYRFVKFLPQELFTYTDTSELPEGLSVIGWDTPTQEEITINYSFLITYGSGSFINQITFTLEQTFYWDFRPGWENLQQLVAISET